MVCKDIPYLFKTNKQCNIYNKENESGSKKRIIKSYIKITIARKK